MGSKQSNYKTPREMGKLEPIDQDRSTIVIRIRREFLAVRSVFGLAKHS